jgi:hypothetical protein
MKFKMARRKYRRKRKPEVDLKRGTNYLLKNAIFWRENI